MNKPIFLYGKHVVESVITLKKRNIYKIITSDQQFFRLYAKSYDCEIMDNKAISKLLSEGAVHGGYVVKCSPKKTCDIDKILINKEKFPTIAVLDQITDPHNVGAIIRSAVSFGINALIIPEHNSVIDSPILAKSASGALENIEITSGNLSKLLEKLKANGYWIFGMDSKAKQHINYIKKFKYKAIVLGSEGSGMRPLVVKSCDDLVKIKTTGLVESLNVSNAAAICFYEIYN